MPRNRVFLFLCLLFVLVLGSASPALAGYPASYEKAKAQFERLEKSGGKAQEWQNCADAFRRSYQNNPNWRLRAAARAVRKNRIPDEPNETNLQKINLS